MVVKLDNALQIFTYGKFRPRGSNFQRTRTRAEKIDVPKTPKICHVCKNPNAWDSKTCSNCAKALDLKTAIEMEDQEKSKVNELEKRLSDTERILRKLEERFDNSKD